MSAANQRRRLTGNSEPLATDRRIYCMEPASFTYDARGVPTGHLIANPGAYSQEVMGLPYRMWGGVSCCHCAGPLSWTGPPRRVGGLWIYLVRGWPESPCRCSPYDFIRSPFRLVVGGTLAWWDARGWDLRPVI